MKIQVHDAVTERESMIRSSNLWAGRPEFSFGLAGAVAQLRLVEPRSGETLDTVPRESSATVHRTKGFEYIRGNVGRGQFLFSLA
jgi:hypothetical protein